MSAKEYLDKWYEAKRWEFYAHVRPWIAIGAEMAKASGWKMTYEQYYDLIDLLDGTNSYERKVLLPVLDDLAICELTESDIRQCGPALGELSLAKHYGDAVERELAPLLVKRLRESDGLLKIALQHLDIARKQTATWEIQAQDLRDQLVQATSELAVRKPPEPRVCDDCGCQLGVWLGDLERHKPDCRNLPL